MLYAQRFKTFEGASKRARFERAHAGDRGNVNYRFFVVRCRDGMPDTLPYDASIQYDYRIEKTLRDHATNPADL